MGGPHLATIDRRTLLASLGLSVLAAPLVSEAQQANLRRIGVLSVGSASSEVSRLGALRDGLRHLGWIEGRTVSLEVRYANLQYERLPVLAAELVKLRVEVLVAAGGTAAVMAARRATNSIPIVFPTMADPVRSGVATSLARPGGNVTGLAIQSLELAAKHVQLLKDSVPDLARVGLITNSSNPAYGQDSPDVVSVRTATRALGLTLQTVDVQRPEDAEAAVVTIARERRVALIVLPDFMLNRASLQFAQTAMKYRMPTIFYIREAAQVGGLMSYGADPLELYRRSATYVDKILKGANPADLPVEQPTKFELVINLKTATALGLTIPQSVLLQATEIIQ